MVLVMYIVGCVLLLGAVWTNNMKDRNNALIDEIKWMQFTDLRFFLCHSRNKTALPPNTILAINKGRKHYTRIQEILKIKGISREVRDNADMALAACPTICKVIIK